MQWVYGNSWLAVPECVGILQVPVRIADHHIANEECRKGRAFLMDDHAPVGGDGVDLDVSANSYQ